MTFEGLRSKITTATSNSPVCAQSRTHANQLQGQRMEAWHTCRSQTKQSGSGSDRETNPLRLGESNQQEGGRCLSEFPKWKVPHTNHCPIAQAMPQSPEANSQPQPNWKPEFSGQENVQDDSQGDHRGCAVEREPRTSLNHFSKSCGCQATELAAHLVQASKRGSLGKQTIPATQDQYVRDTGGAVDHKLTRPSKRQPNIAT